MASPWDPITPSIPADLGQLIFDANPYVKPPPPPPGPPPPPVQHVKDIAFMWDNVETQYEPPKWYFKGQELYVRSALRIPYCYKDAKGFTVTDYLLIGFEGGGV